MGWGGGEQWGWCRPVDKIFYGGGDIQRVDGPNDVRGASLWGRGGGGGLCEGGLGNLRMDFEHFEILDISQTFNLQM